MFFPLPRSQVDAIFSRPSPTTRLNSFLFFVPFFFEYRPVYKSVIVGVCTQAPWSIGESVRSRGRDDVSCWIYYLNEWNKSWHRNNDGSSWCVGHQKHRTSSCRPLRHKQQSYIQQQPHNCNTISDKDCGSGCYSTTGARVHPQPRRSGHNELVPHHQWNLGTEFSTASRKINHRKGAFLPPFHAIFAMRRMPEKL